MSSRQLVAVLKNYFPTVKPFDYAAFIDELRGYIEEAPALVEEDALSESALFRRWKHGVGDAILRVQRLKYRINCEVHGRMYRTGYSHADYSAEVEAFQRDLTSTVDEMKLIVLNFERYGDPHPPPAESPSDVLIAQLRADAATWKEKAVAAEAKVAATPPALLMPERVTLAWIWHNVPAPLMWSAGVGIAALMAGAFATGFAFSSTRLGRTATDLLAPVEQPSSAAKR